MARANQRVMLTKQLLKNSLLTMLETESIHTISIRKLCDSVGINRTTFYNHYGSPYDVLAEMENDLLTQLQKHITGLQSPKGAKDVHQVTEMLHYLENNIKLSRLLINNNIDSDFPQKFLDLPQIRSILDSYLSERYKPEQVPYAKEYIIHGSYQLVKTWINKDTRESAEYISTMLNGLIDKLL